MKRVFGFAAIFVALAPSMAWCQLDARVPAGDPAYQVMDCLAQEGLVLGDFSGKSERTRFDFAVQLAALPDFNLGGLEPSTWQAIVQLKARFDAELQAIDRKLQKSSDRIQYLQDQGDAMEADTDAVIKQIRANTYSGSSSPQFTGILTTKAQDISGDGRANRHGTGIMENMTLSVLDKLSDNTEVDFNFAPAFSPAFLGNNYNSTATDDLDQMKAGPSTTASSASAGIFDRLAMVISTPSTRTAFGFQYMHTTPLTLFGKLSDRPEIFDRNPYASNVPTKSTFESQFLTGVPKRAPEESEHPIMGVLNTWTLPKDLTLMTFAGYNEGFFDAPAIALHEIGTELTWDKTAEDFGGAYHLVAYNRSNDNSEWFNAGGSPDAVAPSTVLVNQLDNVMLHGLQNNTVFSVYAQQKLGKKSTLNMEVASAAYANALGQGTGYAAKFDYETQLSPGFKLLVGGYSISPQYIVMAGKYQANGLNDVIYNGLPANTPGAPASGLVQQTVVSDPTLPMINTNTLSVGAQFSFFHTFFNVNLQDSQQIEPTSAVVESKHFLNGDNLQAGSWWALYNNNYLQWDPAGSPTIDSNLQMDSYNRSYYVGKTITAQDGIGYNASYHQLEAYQWRTTMEGILTSDPVTGLPLNLSAKSIAHASLDMRSNLAEMTGSDRDCFLEVYEDMTTVNDASLIAPSMDPSNLFAQNIATATLIYNISNPVNLMLNAGYETWLSDRVANAVPVVAAPAGMVSGNPLVHPGRLEYYERSAGAGIDWDVLPNRLSLYFRVKVFHHYDAAYDGNNFIGRQMWWEMKSYF